MMDRRIFLKMCGVTVASVPLLSLEKENDVPDKVDVSFSSPPKDVYGVFCVHGKGWKEMWLVSGAERYYMPVEREHLEVALSDTPHIFRHDTTVACFTMCDAFYQAGGHLVITYACNDPQFFLGLDDKLHMHGRRGHDS